MQNRLFLGLITTAVLILSCNNPFHVRDTLDAAADTKLASLRIETSGAGGLTRTILPQPLIPEDLLYDVRLEGDAADPIELTSLPHNQLEITDLPTGEYTLHITGTDNDGNSLFSTQDGGIAIVLTGGLNSITAQLFPLRLASGGLQVDISWPTDLIDTAEILWTDSLASLPGTAPAFSYSTNIEAGTLSVATAGDEIPSGTYFMTVHLRSGNGEIAALILEAIHIYDYQTSAATFELEAAQISQAPDAPVSATAETIQNSNQFPQEVQLVWDDASPISTGYQVYRFDGAEYAAIGDTIPKGTTTFTDSDLNAFAAGENVQYRITSFNLFGHSDPLDVTAVMPPVPLTGSSEPNGDTDVDAFYGIQLSLEQFEGADQILLYFGSQDTFSSDTPFATLAGEDTSYSISAADLEPETTYSWALEATNAGGSYKTEPASGTYSFTTRGAEWFVSPSGSNQERGSADYPLATIAAALNRAPAEGGVIHLEAGTYSESLSMSDSITVRGSYTAGFNDRSLDPPTSVITNAGGGTTTQALSISGVTDLLLDGVVFRPPVGSSHTYGLNISGTNSITLENTLIAIPQDTVAEMSIRGINLAGAGQLNLINSEISLGGSAIFDLDAGAYRTAYGIWIFSSYSGGLYLDGTTFSTSGYFNQPDSGIVNARSMYQLYLQGGTAARTFEIHNSHFSGSITGNDPSGQPSAAISAGGTAENTVWKIFDTQIEGIVLTEQEFGTRGISLLAGQALDVQRSRFTMDSTQPGNVEAIFTAGVPEVTLNANKIAMRGKSLSGTAFGIRITGTPETPSTLISNNIIEVYGAEADRPSHGIETAIPDSRLIHNTVVFAVDYGHTATSSNPFRFTGTAANSIAANNILLSLPATQHIPFSASAAGMQYYSNLLFGTQDTTTTLNDSGSNNVYVEPLLNTAAAVADNDWYAPTNESPAELSAGGNISYLSEVDTDINGNPRVSPSIGAYESDSEVILAHWPFPEGSEMTDSGVLGNDLSVAAEQSEPSYSENPIGNFYLMLQNETDGLAAEGSTTLRLGNSGQSYSFWYYGNDFGVQGSIISRYRTDATPHARAIGIGSADAATMRINVNNTAQLAADVANTELTQDEWNHILVVFDYDDALVQVYVNGGLVNSAALSNTSYGNMQAAGPLYIGKQPEGGGASRAVVGSLDDIRVYNYPADGAFASDLYQAGR